MKSERPSTPDQPQRIHTRGRAPGATAPYRHGSPRRQYPVWPCRGATSPGAPPGGGFSCPVCVDGRVRTGKPKMPPKEAEGKLSIKCVDSSRHTSKTSAYPLTGGKPTPSRCVDCLVTPWKPGMILVGKGGELPRCVWIRGGRTHAPADEPTKRDKGVPPGVWIGEGVPIPRFDFTVKWM